MSWHDSTGALIASNDDYSTDPANAFLETFGLAPPSELESALFRSLAPGAYTVILRGVGGVGVGLVEVYDADLVVNGHAGDSRLANISTRGEVGAGDDVMIGGFIVGGSDRAQMVIRGLGPSLVSNVSSAVLPNPKLGLYNGDGTEIASNDNWQELQAKEIEATGLAPTDPLESAIDVSVSPGNYTAILSGVDGGTGIGLVEVYNIP
ncbi:MAG: hypothetical protein ABI233_05855 [Chthoniobacterales bacterium]